MKDPFILPRVSYQSISNGSSQESLDHPFGESTKNNGFNSLTEVQRKRHYISNNKCKCICNKECPFETRKGHTPNRDPIGERSRKCDPCSFCRRLNRGYLLFGLIVSLVGLLFSYYFMESCVESFVEGRLVLREGTDRFESWRRGHPPTLYKVWIFNLTNEQAFMDGARPLVKEVGPYVYEVKELKKDIMLSVSDNTLTFYPHPIFKFMPALSFGSEDDVFTTLNVPLINAGVQAQNSLVLQNILKVASRVHNFPSTRRLTVRHLLWGHRSHVLDWARRLKDIPYPHEYFGLMAGRNNTPQSPYTINTGAEDIAKIMTVNAYEGRSSLGIWESPICDSVHGSLPSGFHPNVLPSETLHVFSGQICRSLPLVFERNCTQSGLEAFRFILPPDAFTYDGHPTNWCFCKDDICPPRGVLDVRACYYGAAIAFSFPHFYEGDPVLRHVVRGLRPDPELHGTQFDIYPKLGVPLRVKLRMQMNVVIDSKQALQRARHFDVVFPVFWFEAGIDSLPGDMVGMLKMAQNLPSVVKTTSVTVCTTLTVLFLLLLFASSMAGWCGITPHSSRTQTPDHLPDTHWPATHPHSILNSSGYTPGSMASLGPDDLYRTGLPPYRKSFYPNGDIQDGFPNGSYDIPPSEDQPPAYTSAPDTTKASSSSLLSVEIHKSPSIHSTDTPTPTKMIEEEFAQKQAAADSEERGFDNSEYITSSPPSTPAESPVAVPLAKEDDNIEAPLATSSRHESPNTTTIPAEEGETRPPSACSIQSTPSRPPPLESDL